MNPIPNSPKATRIVLLGIIGVAFLLRIATLTTQSLWRDEVDVILFSSWPLYDLLAGLFIKGHNGPLFFLLMRPWRTLMGDSEFALRYPSVAFGTMVIPLGFALVRELGLSQRVGILLTLLLATSPYLVWYGQEAKMYSLLLALITFAFIAYLRALRPKIAHYSKNLGNWTAFVVATSLSFYTHILSPLILVVYGAGAFLYPSKINWRVWLLSMSCLTIPYIPLVFWQISLLHENIVSGHPFYSLKEELLTLLQVYSSGLISFVGKPLIVYYVFLFLVGLFLPFMTQFNHDSFSLKISYPMNILVVWVLLPPLLIYLISLRVAVFEDRYLIYITPPFYLLVVIGLVKIAQRSRMVASFCLGIILMCNMIGLWQQHQPIKADFRAAATYLTRHATPSETIMIQIPYLKYTLRYYYPGDYPLLEGLWTNDGKTEAIVDAEMTALTMNNLTDLWLVVSEEEMWDSRGLTRAWLNRHAQLVDEAHFIRVELYHYHWNR